MQDQKSSAPLAVTSCLAGLHLSLGLAFGATTLPDRADVPAAQNPPGWDYDVYYNNDMMSVDLLPDMNAGWIRDAVLNSHNTFVGFPYGFRPPRFSATPNNICISSTASGCWANAPEDRINVNNCINGQTEPFTRSVLVHEMFHHVQYAYINFGDWPTWGQWTVEGTPPAMEDRSRADIDGNAMNSRFVGDVGGHFGNPNVKLMDRVYDAAPFWNYISEQFGTVTTEPARGTDVIRNFWERTAGNSPDSVRYLRDTIRGFAPLRSLEDVFIDFAVANFTHNLNLSRLSPAQRARYSYIDETAAGGGTAYPAVARTAVAMLNTTLNSSVVSWGAQYFEGNIDRLGCQVVGVRGKAASNKTLGWAVIGIRSGNRVSEIYRGIGNVFYKAFINDPSDSFERIGLVVVGLNDGADFEYALGFGQLSGAITLPVMTAPAYVGRLNEPPERFQIRLRLLGPAVLTPEGLAPVSVRGIDASQLLINLRSRATGVLYPVTGIINADYVSGESHAGEQFERSVTRFFSVYEYDESNQELKICDPDTDNDGMPDRWEDLYGLNKNSAGDATGDFDDDGLKNLDEFLQGTLPLNPDTDGGGEADGSEVANGRDPLYDRDDTLPAVIDFGVVNKVADIPLPFPLEPNAVVLRFPVNTAYRFMQVWRTDANGLDFKLAARVNLGTDRSGLYFDRGLVSNAEYLYFLRAEGLSGAVTPATEIFLAIPKADPVPPDGAVVINGGAPFTTSPNVTLNLLASSDAATVLISQNPSFAGTAPLPMATTALFTLAGPLPGPFVATVYVKYRDAALNESILYHDSILVDANGDTDNDRLYDPWERTHFGDLSHGPTDDDDGDDVSNLEEFRNGTDPRDPCSPQCGVRSIRQAGWQVIIEYTGTLESSESVEGPYLPVAGATSPYSLNPTAKTQFFRAR